LASTGTITPSITGLHWVEDEGEIQPSVIMKR